MGKKYKNLFHMIYQKDRLWRSFRKASKGKIGTGGFLLFKDYEGANIATLSEQIENESYAPGKHNQFYVHEPKPRLISALPFQDRVVQHSLYSVISPMFEKTFLPYSFACREGKGTHSGVKFVQAILRKNPKLWALKVDFKGYFYNIDREILWKEIDRKLSCKKTKNLLALFHPKDGKGLPIGNLTSQLLANIYGHILDRHLAHDLRIKKWARYMDDTVIFGESREELEVILKDLTVFIEKEMKLEWSKWNISPTSKGVNFLGYRIWPTHKLIRPDSVRRAKRKIKKYQENNETEKLSKFVASWSGHIKWANSFNLKTKLLGSVA